MVAEIGKHLEEPRDIASFAAVNRQTAVIARELPPTAPAFRIMRFLKAALAEQAVPLECLPFQHDSFNERFPADAVRPLPSRQYRKVRAGIETGFSQGYGAGRYVELFAPLAGRLDTKQFDALLNLCLQFQESDRFADAPFKLLRHANQLSNRRFEQIVETFDVGDKRALTSRRLLLESLASHNTLNEVQRATLVAYCKSCLKHYSEYKLETMRLRAALLILDPAATRLTHLEEELSAQLMMNNPELRIVASYIPRETLSYALPTPAGDVTATALREYYQPFMHLLPPQRVDALLAASDLFKPFARRVMHVIVAGAEHPIPQPRFDRIVSYLGGLDDTDSFAAACDLLPQITDSEQAEQIIESMLRSSTRSFFQDPGMLGPGGFLRKYDAPVCTALRAVSAALKHLDEANTVRLLAVVRSFPAMLWSREIAEAFAQSVNPEKICEYEQGVIDVCVILAQRASLDYYFEVPYPLIRLMTDEQKRAVATAYIASGARLPLGKYLMDFPLEQQKRYLEAVVPQPICPDSIGRLEHAAHSIAEMPTQRWREVVKDTRFSAIP